jgi:nucleotide-binding universal stress UspA family protein
MLTVLITTDFSEAAHNASLYGVELASKIGAKIVLMNVFTVPLSVPESYVIVNPVEVKKTAEQYLMDEALAIKKSDLQPIDIIAVEGPTTEMIIKQASKYENCLIVMGMKGEGATVRRLFGSTVSGMARKSDCALLIVPENILFKSIDKIALATSKDYYSDYNSVDLLKLVGERFDSKVSVVMVLNHDFSVVDELVLRSNRLINKLKPLQTNYTFPRSDDITSALNDFSEKNNIDILALMPHHHPFIERLFVKSETRDMIFHSHVPLLLLPDATHQFQKDNSKLQHQHS